MLGGMVTGGRGGMVAGGMMTANSGPNAVSSLLLLLLYTCPNQRELETHSPCWIEYTTVP